MARRFNLLGILILLAFFTPTARGQFNGGLAFNSAPGVFLDVNGNVGCRQVDEKDHLAAVRARAKAGAESAKNEKLVYISLPKLFAQLQAIRLVGKEVPEELRFLGGLTQLRYVLVYPDEKKIVIAGPAEPWLVVQGQGDAAQFVVGKRTGRPILQLDDLIVAMRTAREGKGNVFGCGIYPSPNAMKIADDIVRRMASNTRAERMKALAEGLGPQPVKIFGTRADTRFAYICVAADYEMKRFALGMDRAPIANLGSAMDNSRSAISKFWFAANYDPLLVSRDGNTFEIRGKRLELQCGAFDFDVRGATETAKRWADHFSKEMPALAAAEPLFAELQNIADEALLGNLLLRDRLPEKAGWDANWIYDEAACPVAKVPVAKTADTLVAFTNGSLVAGGVSLSLTPTLDPKSRETDDKATLDSQKHDLAKLRSDGARANDTAVVRAK